MNHVDVAVLVRTCGRPLFLRRALQSIAQQTTPPRQVVVVAEGDSEPAIRELAESAWPGRAGEIEVIANLVPVGRGAALNCGFRAARAAWVAILDDDDTWEPTFLEAILARNDQDRGSKREPAAYVTQTVTVHERLVSSEWAETIREPFNPKLHQVRLRDMVLMNRFTINSMLVPRAFFEAVGPYREDLPVLEDWEFNVRLVARYPVHVIPVPLARYHKREEASGADLNTALALHREIAARLKEEWLRADIQSGRFGLGFLAQIAEIESNHGLRLANRLAAWFGR